MLTNNKTTSQPPPIFLCDQKKVCHKYLHTPYISFFPQMVVITLLGPLYADMCKPSKCQTSSSTQVLGLSIYLLSTKLETDLFGKWLLSKLAPRKFQVEVCLKLVFHGHDHQRTLLSQA